MIADFPKIECPFVRKVYQVDQSDFKRCGSRLGLREPNVYLVTPEINPGYEWVIEHKDTIAVEKLHGSGVSVATENDRIVRIQNRLNEVDMYQIKGGRSFLVEAVLLAVGRDLVERSGIQYGEALGPKINGNIYKLSHHLWYPFAKAQDSLRYTSFHRYPKSFESFNGWFHTSLKSLFYCRTNKIPFSEMFTREDVPFAEGVVFYNSTLPVGDRSWMAKLRRDMFPWHYWGEIHIKDLPDWALSYAASKSIIPKGY